MTMLAVRPRSVHGPTPGARFSSESDLAGPVRAWLSQALALVVGDEIDAGSGIADLVGGCLSREELPTRLAFPSPISTQLLEFAQGSVRESELRVWAPHGWRGLRDRVVQPLIRAGLLSMSDVDEEEAIYRSETAASDPFARLVAVELKLRDWRRAIAQAGRYRLFAEQSYVALPATRVTEVVLVEARRNQVGVLSVEDDTTVTETLYAPISGPLQPNRRRWASEQLLASLQAPSARVAGSPIR